MSVLQAEFVCGPGTSHSSEKEEERKTEMKMFKFGTSVFVLGLLLIVLFAKLNFPEPAFIFPGLVAFGGLGLQQIGVWKIATPKKPKSGDK